MRRLPHEAVDVDCHTGRPVGLQFFQALAQLGHRSMPVALSPVVEADTYLKDALIEIADRVRLLYPDAFQSFVLLEEFLLVELFDPGEQSSWWRVITAAGAPGCRLARRLDQAEAWLPTEARTLSPSGEAAGSSR